MADSNWTALIVVVVCLGSTILCLLLVCSCALLILWRKVKASNAGAVNAVDPAGLAKLKTAPGAALETPLVDDVGAAPTQVQNAVTFVVTDVAGSTELWEWNAEAMDLALQLHDATLRTLLFQHKGHEVTTEGDSFTVVFHDATDALQWCLQVQKALLELDWPAQLLTTKAAGEEWGQREVAVSMTMHDLEQYLVFRGLRVRMGVHTGSNCSISRHPVTGQWEYSGATRALAEQISDAGHGGQILICATTSNDIYSRLPMLVPQPSGALSSTLGRTATSVSEGSAAGALRPSKSQSFSKKVRRASAVMLQRQHSSCHQGTSAAAASRAGLRRSMCDRNIMQTREVYMPDTQEEGTATFRRSLSNPASVVSRALLSMASFPKARFQEVNTMDEFDDIMSSRIVVDSSGPLLIDMGRYTLKATGDEPKASEMRIMLVLHHHLSGRLQFWPLALTIPCSTPTYFEAPGAADTVQYLGRAIPAWARPCITICFCSLQPGSLEGMSAETAAELLAVFAIVVRVTLQACAGYECQEKEGVFMLAFHHTRAAVEWGLTLQLGIMEADWGAYDGLGVQKDDQGTEVFRGVRARVGMFHGEVIKVVPHSRTGRADYFGMVLNRSARVQGAAHGGQVLAEGLAMDKIAQEWRVLYQQAKPAGRSGKGPKYLPGSLLLECGLEDWQSADGLPVPPFHCDPALSTFDSESTDLLATSVGVQALLDHEELMLSRLSLHHSETLPKIISQAAASPVQPRIPVQVDIHDLGLLSLKGVESHIAISCITPSSLSGRFALYPKDLPSPKARLVKRGAGLLDTVTVDLPDVSRMPFARPRPSRANSSMSLQPLQPGRLSSKPPPSKQSSRIGRQASRLRVDSDPAAPGQASQSSNSSGARVHTEASAPTASSSSQSNSYFEMGTRMALGPALLPQGSAPRPDPLHAAQAAAAPPRRGAQAELPAWAAAGGMPSCGSLESCSTGSAVSTPAGDMQLPWQLSARMRAARDSAPQLTRAPTPASGGTAQRESASSACNTSGTTTGNSSNSSISAAALRRKAQSIRRELAMQARRQRLCSLSDTPPRAAPGRAAVADRVPPGEQRAATRTWHAHSGGPWRGKAVPPRQLAAQHRQGEPGVEAPQALGSASIAHSGTRGADVQGLQGGPEKGASATPQGRPWWLGEVEGPSTSDNLVDDIISTALTFGTTAEQHTQGFSDDEGGFEGAIDASVMKSIESGSLWLTADMSDD